MNRPNVIKLIRVCILIVLLFVSPPIAVSKMTTFKIATVAPEGSSWIQTFEELNAELKQKTNNNVRIKVYAGGVIGDEKDMMRKMYVGQIQGAALTSAGLSGIFKEMDVFQIPFLFETYDGRLYLCDWNLYAFLIYEIQLNAFCFHVPLSWNCELMYPKLRDHMFLLRLQQRQFFYLFFE